MTKHGQPLIRAADVSLDEAISRARALVPRLRARSLAQDAHRGLLPETVADIRASQLLRYQMPRRWGGMELPFPAIVEVPAVIAEGCASTSWDFHALANHSWILGMYDDRAQEEVWADDPDALIAAGIAFPQGRGRKVDGGYEIGGYWNFCSGVNASPWCMFATTIRDRDDGPPVDYRMCLVRAGEYEVIDDWQVLGMRGTGSQSCKTNALFVPEHRALPMLTIRGQGDYPGARVNPGPLFRVPLVAAAGYFPSPTAIGNAQAMLDLVRERLVGRDHPQMVPIRLAYAAAKLDAARSLMRADAQQLWADACAARVRPALDKLAYKRNAALVMQFSMEVADVLYALLNDQALANDDTAQQLFRDAHAITAHISGSFDAQGSAWGAAALGVPDRNPML